MEDMMDGTQSSNNRIVIFGASAVILIALAFLIYSAFATLGEPVLSSADSGNTAASSDEPVLESTDFGTINDEIEKIPNGFGGIDVGDVAPDFSVVNLDGDTVQLSDYAGQPIMLNFWATWCAPCRLEMPEMQKAYEAYKDEGFVILALNQDESSDVVEEFFYDDMELSFTPVIDENSRVANEYGVYGINPSSLFIDTDGIVTARHFSIVTESQLDEYIAEILPKN